MCERYILSDTVHKITYKKSYKNQKNIIKIKGLNFLDGINNETKKKYTQLLGILFSLDFFFVFLQ